MRVLAVSPVVAIVIPFQADGSGCVIYAEAPILQVFSTELGAAASLKLSPFLCLAHGRVGDTVAFCYATEPLVPFKRFRKTYSIEQMRLSSNRSEPKHCLERGTNQ